MAERRRVAPPSRVQGTQLETDLDNLQSFMTQVSEQVMIDRHALDDAVMWQAEAMARIGNCLAIIKSQRDDAKDYIKEVEARLDEDMRIDMAKNGQKVTETQVKAAIIRSREYQDAKRRHQYLSRDAERLGNLKDTYADRSWMVREMVTLDRSGYFADRAGRGRDPETYGYRSRDRNR